MLVSKNMISSTRDHHNDLLSELVSADINGGCLLCINICGSDKNGSVVFDTEGSFIRMSCLNGVTITLGPCCVAAISTKILEIHANNNNNNTNGDDDDETLKESFIHLIEWLYNKIQNIYINNIKDNFNAKTCSYRWRRQLRILQLVRKSMKDYFNHECKCAKNRIVVVDETSGFNKENSYVFGNGYMSNVKFDWNSIESMIEKFTPLFDDMHMYRYDHENEYGDTNSSIDYNYNYCLDEKIQLSSSVNIMLYKRNYKILYKELYTKIFNDFDDLILSNKQLTIDEWIDHCKQKSTCTLKFDHDAYDTYASQNMIRVLEKFKQVLSVNTFAKLDTSDHDTMNKDGKQAIPDGNGDKDDNDNDNNNDDNEDDNDGHNKHDCWRCKMNKFRNDAFKHVLLLSDGGLQTESFIVENKLIGYNYYFMQSYIDDDGKYNFYYGNYQTLKLSKIIFDSVDEYIPDICIPIVLCNMIADFCSGGNKMKYVDCIFDNFIKLIRYNQSDQLNKKFLEINGWDGESDSEWQPSSNQGYDEDDDDDDDDENDDQDTDDDHEELARVVKDLIKQNRKML